MVACYLGHRHVLSNDVVEAHATATNFLWGVWAIHVAKSKLIVGCFDREGLHQPQNCIDYSYPMTCIRILGNSKPWWCHLVGVALWFIWHLFSNRQSALTWKRHRDLFSQKGLRGLPSDVTVGGQNILHLSCDLLCLSLTFQSLPPTLQSSVCLRKCLIFMSISVLFHKLYSKYPFTSFLYSIRMYVCLGLGGYVE